MTAGPRSRWAAAGAAAALLVLIAASSRGVGPTGAETPGPPPAAAAPATPEGPPAPAPDGGEEPVVPRDVRPVAGLAPGANDSNPAWAPGGDLVGFERSRGEGREIVIARPEGGIVRTVSIGPAEGESSLLPIPGEPGGASYNGGLSWSPSGKRFVFMSNGGEGNYDLYLGTLAGTVSRLTDHREKEGHAHWSPASDNLVVFVSGRSGKGDLYLLNPSSRALRRLTQGRRAFLYPRWSPDGRSVAVTHGADGNHDIYVIGDVDRPRETMRALTTWPWDDIRPVWSPDGSKIAFYSNANAQGDPESWSIVVVAASGRDPREGPGLMARIAARDVVPDVETGPAWLPDGTGLMFVKNDRREYNPIHVVDLASGAEQPVRTGTKMNHDVSCSSDGRIAFRAQVDQWDHLFVATLPWRSAPR